ncbi:alpha/beta hydrolase [Lacticaseibacillus jixiensis]|uniref:alpha/beta hydrolase n=1 Tax=Lacticaseibacillus jixiensis TaxID=3231926 RepID=UPI0036F346F8
MRKWLWVIGLCLLLMMPAPTPVHAASTHQTVTLYLHGHHGNGQSMLPLIHDAMWQAQATPALVAVVNNDGQVSFRGRLPANANRPLVQVIFMNNHTVDYRQLRWWLHNVMQGLAQRYGVRQVNIVAHSLGNTAVEWYLLRYGRQPELPRVVRWVSIAGNFDGIPRMHMQPRHNRIEANGRPDLLAPQYRQALLKRRHFPAVAILNVYGDLQDGSHADGRILNASSRALGYLVRGQAASYQEQRFVGRDASHRRLRFNRDVALATDAFLW